MKDDRSCRRTPVRTLERPPEHYDTDRVQKGVGPMCSAVSFKFKLVSVDWSWVLVGVSTWTIFARDVGVFHTACEVSISSFVCIDPDGSRPECGIMQDDIFGSWSSQDDIVQRSKTRQIRGQKKEAPDRRSSSSIEQGRDRRRDQSDFPDACLRGNSRSMYASPTPLVI